MLELHSSTTCVTDDVRIAKVKIEGVTEATKVVNVALEEFELGGASLEAVRTVVWREFGQGGYEIGEIKLKCGRVGGGGQVSLWRGEIEESRADQDREAGYNGEADQCGGDEDGD